MKKLIAFDLDDTLAPSKSALDDRMGEVFVKLLDKFTVCVISGGRFEQFQTQLLNNLKASPDQLSKLHLMPTCGTRYHRYNQKTKEWDLVYAEDFTKEEKQKIIHALEQGVTELGLVEKKTYGPTIEDRGSQITFSALGQDIVAELGAKGVEMKAQWDPDASKKQKLRNYVARLIPEFEVRVGGGTSVDITKPGIDKAYGMQKLIEMLSLTKEDILFVGDRLIEGGNDYPVKAMGIDSFEVSNWEHTVRLLEVILVLV